MEVGYKQYYGIWMFDAQTLECFLFNTSDAGEIG